MDRAIRSGRETPIEILTGPTTVIPSSRSDSESVDGLVALYREHRNAAFALAYRMLGERGLAEDAVQEAFLNLCHRGNAFDSNRGAARTWLLTIVHHRAIDVLRRQRANTRADIDIESVTSLPSREDTWMTVAARLECSRVQQAIAVLPLEQQHVIALCYYGDLTQAAAAARLGIPLGTVKGRLRLALKKLRAVLAAEERAETQTGVT